MYYCHANDYILEKLTTHGYIYDNYIYETSFRKRSFNDFSIVE